MRSVTVNGGPDYYHQLTTPPRGAQGPEAL